MKRIIAAAAITAGLTGIASGAEFQPIGTLGMGGAGVARSMGPYAAYWNPAGLAFAEKRFTMTAGGGAGLRVSDGLADNVDRLAKFTEGNPSAFDNLDNLSTTGSNVQAVADIAALLTVIKDIETQKGTISLNVDGGVGFQIKQFGVGIFGTGEGFAMPVADTLHVLPEQTGTTNAINAATLAQNAAGQSTGWNPASPSFFSPAQVQNMTSQLTAAALGLSGTQINDIIAAIDKGLASVNTASVTPEAVEGTLIQTLIPILQNPGQNTINNNRTAVLVKNVIFAEVPIAYGHAIDFGDRGKLGIGGALKVVRGRVYQSRIQLLESNDSVSSDDITDALRDNYEESNNVTIDMGAQYKYSNWLTLGLVAKNLTSPSFKSPEMKDQQARYVDRYGVVEGQAGFAGRYREPDVKLKPQVRFGVAVDPYWWLTLAADLDVTENDTVLTNTQVSTSPSSTPTNFDYKSRHLGAGFEIHALSWLKIRGGIYKNIANGDIGPVATGGLTFGIPWVLLEVDGAYGLDTAQYKEKDYPKEAKVHAQLTVQF